MIRGEQQTCFAVTEPDAGLNTTAIETRAVREEGGYRVNGRKMWTTTAQIAHKIIRLRQTQRRADHTSSGLVYDYSGSHGKWQQRLGTGGAASSYCTNPCI